jgi:hypothetical protein
MAIRINDSLSLGRKCDDLFRGGGKKKLDVFFPPKKPKMFWGVVTR